LPSINSLLFLEKDKKLIRSSIQSRKTWTI